MTIPVFAKGHLPLESALVTSRLLVESVGERALRRAASRMERQRGEAGLANQSPGSRSVAAAAQFAAAGVPHVLERGRASRAAAQ